MKRVIATIVCMAAGWTAHAEELDQQALTELFSGEVTFAFNTVRDFPALQTFKPDGSLVVTWVDGGVHGQDSGKWWMKGNVLCILQDKWLQRERCMQLRKADVGYDFRKPGSSKRRGYMYPLPAATPKDW